MNSVDFKTAIESIFINSKLSIADCQFPFFLDPLIVCEYRPMQKVGMWNSEVELTILGTTSDQDPAISVRRKINARI